MPSIHKPVLLNEITDSLAKAAPKGRLPVYLDGTLGGAGHALSIAKALNGQLTVIGLDLDKEAIERAKGSLAGKCQNLILEKENFRNMDKALERHGIKAVNMMLLDLGYSSDELENSGKGFSFQKDEPLLMTLGDPDEYPFTAKTIVNDWDEAVLADIIFGYGEDRFARRIAKAITIYRSKKPIETSGELAEIVKSSVPAVARRAKIHPATKTFQALRIAVNDELKALHEGLEKGYENLAEGGRLAVISFHSLEDRMVKEFFKKKEKSGQGKLLTKKPMKPEEKEVAENPRSRSAKLRIIEKADFNKITKNK